MLMTAGYLNYTTNTNKQASLETAMQIEASDDMQLADIGDATLVNSNDVVEEKEESTENLDTNTNTSSNSNINNGIESTFKKSQT